MAKKKQKEEPEIIEIGKELTEIEKIKAMDAQIIKDNMKELGLIQADLVRYLGINKGTLSSGLSGARELPLSMKKLLHFYFISKRVEKLFPK